MPVETRTIRIPTKGFNDVLDLTDEIRFSLESTQLKSGVVTIFVPGATAGITTMEFESGCVSDLKDTFEKMVPHSGHYAHNARWGDGNGFSHVRAAILGASLQVPFSNKRLLTGTWQQIVLVDFDNRPRRREVILQFMGDS